MATQSFTVDDSAYVLVSSTDCLMQCVSSTPVRLVFSTTQPEVAHEDYHILSPKEGITKQGGLPSDDMYVLSNHKGRVAKVVVSA